MLIRLHIKISFIVLLVFYRLACYADPGNQRIESSWKQYSGEQDNQKKLNILFDIGGQYFSANEPQKRDSVFQIALELEYIPLNGNNNAALMNTYKWYFSKTYTLKNKNAAVYALRMETIANNNNDDEWLYDTYMVLYNVYFTQNKADLALSYINKAYYYASIINKENFKAQSLLALGECQERNNNKIEAFRNYMDALYIADKINNDTILYNVYQSLSYFFKIINNYEKAKEYKQKQFSMLLSQKAVDSVKLMWLYDDFSGILFNNKEREQGENIIKQEIAYSYRHNDVELKKSALTIYRTFLIENNYLKDLTELYTVKYPDELQRINTQNPLLYLRLMAYISEVNGHIDSAENYYMQAEKMMLGQQQNPIQVSNFYRRYGQFELRKNDLALSDSDFEKSYDYAAKAAYLPYMIEATGYMDSINNIQKNYSKAYTYAKLNYEYKDELAATTKKEELLQLEINNEVNQRKLAKEREQMQIAHRHSLQYMGIMIVIAFSFILLAMLGSFKVPKIWIKFIGFISFILLFEFIIIVTDAQVESFTKGEPWKILLFKLAIISILAPLHHWLEHKVLEYLYEHKLIDPSKLSVKHILSRVRKKTNGAEQKE